MERPLGTHEMTPEEVVAWRAEVWDILERLCKLQQEVCERSLGYDHAADCFCGLGGFWGIAPGERNFRNDRKAIVFIEDAVREKLDRLAAKDGTGA